MHEFMTHYERAAKYVTKKLGKRFTRQHIVSLMNQFREVAEEARELTLDCGQPMTIDEAQKEFRNPRIIDQTYQIFVKNHKDTK